jgi:hypothetical protein
MLSGDNKKMPKNITTSIKFGKINVEWSGPLTTVAQNNYDLEKINVEWLMPKDITRKNKC